MRHIGLFELLRVIIGGYLLICSIALKGQAPEIFYPAGAKVFVVGAPVSAISPVNTGGVVSHAGNWLVRTLAGNGKPDSVNGPALQASFNGPAAVAVDKTGNVYVADYNNNIVRKITPGGQVSTFAGSGSIGSKDSIGRFASFYLPVGVAVDKDGNVYVADALNHKIRRITPDGVVSTFSGIGREGFRDGAATVARFYWPEGIAFDKNGILFVADNLNNRIRRVGLDGRVTTFAGTGNPGYADEASGFGMFLGLSGIAIDNKGNIYVADAGNSRIRMVSPSKAITTIAGNEYFGHGDGFGTQATFNYPRGVSVSYNGDLYVTDRGNGKIRRITPDGYVSTLVGTVVDGIDSGKAATFPGPLGIAIDSIGNIFISDEVNHTIKKMAQSGYFINPALPAGLRLDSLTGVITGKPALPFPPTNFTVWATNEYGSSTHVINLSATSVKPVIKSFTPSSAFSGDSILIKGQYLSGISDVKFGRIPADSFYVMNDSTIVAMVGPGESGKVSITNYSGTASLPGFTYLKIPPPNISYPSVNSKLIVGTTLTPLVPVNTGGLISGNGKITITTYAGSLNTGGNDGIASTATFYQVKGLAADVNGNIYAADNNKIRKVNTERIVSTLAGDGVNGFEDGIGTAARLNGPLGIAVDSVGNVYVADNEGNRIRKITPSGVVTTIAGHLLLPNGEYLMSPRGVATDRKGNIFLTDSRKIRKISPNGVVSDFAGSGAEGTNDGIGLAASFTVPYAITIDNNDNLYVTDIGVHSIRKITPNAQVSTLAGGNGAGKADGLGAEASFDWPVGIAADRNGHLYVADENSGLIRKVSPAGQVITIAGKDTSAFANNSGTALKSLLPYSIASDIHGNLFIGDRSMIRRMSMEGGYMISPALPDGLMIDGTTGIISGTPLVATEAAEYTVWATNASGSSVYKISFSTEFARPVIHSFSPASAYADSVVTIKGKSFTKTTRVQFGGTDARNFKVLNDTTILATVGNGSDGSIRITAPGGSDSLEGFNFLELEAPQISYPSGTINLRVGSAINPIIPVNSGGFITGKEPVRVTTFAGNNDFGSADGLGTAAGFNKTGDMAVDKTGNVYVADRLNHKIRKITPEGMVSTIAGTGESGNNDGPALTARFWNPTGIAVDTAGNVFVADQTNHKIRKIGIDGNVSTFAGYGSEGSNDGNGLAATFSSPAGLAIDGAGNIYVADRNNHKIRKISPSGDVTTVAGYGLEGFVNGPGSQARFRNPIDVAIDSAGYVYVTDRTNNVVRKIATNGFVSTFSGNGFIGSTDGPAFSASFNNLNGVAIDPDGNLLVADSWNLKIRKISPVGSVSTYTGSGISGSKDDTSGKASFFFPLYVAVGPDGSLYVSDEHKIRRVFPRGGYAIFPALPAGLKIDPINGIISGTPTVVTPPTNYKVTATNAVGNSSWELTLATQVFPPSITGISKLTGPINSIIAITGNNLMDAAVSMSPNRNLVKLSNTDTSLLLQLPDSAISSILKIVTPGGSVNTPFFTIEDSANQLQHQAGQTLTLTAPDSVTSYQWQVNKGNGFENINNDEVYSGATSHRLNAINIPTAWSGYQYRVLMNESEMSAPLTLRFYNYIMSDGDWSNPLIWASGAIPDQFSDVVVLKGNFINVDVSTAIRSFVLSNAQLVNILPGVKLTITH